MPEKVKSYLNKKEFFCVDGRGKTLFGGIILLAYVYNRMHTP